MSDENSAPDDGAGSVTIQENWKEALPEDLRADPILDRFNDVPAMAKALASAQRMVGADKIVIPAANDRQGWELVYDRLGRPGSAEGYDLHSPEDMPEGFAPDEGMVRRFRAEAHKLGLTGDQAAGLYQWFLSSEGERFVDVNGQIDALRSRNESELRREWAGRYDDKLAQANEAARVLLGDDGLRQLADGGYSSDPMVMQLLAAVGERVVEGRVDGEGPRSMGRSPTEARSEIARLHGDQEFIKAYQDRAHTGHEDAVARMSRLYEQAYPGGESSTAPS